MATLGVWGLWSTGGRVARPGSSFSDGVLIGSALNWRLSGEQPLLTVSTDCMSLMYE